MDVLSAAPKITRLASVQIVSFGLCFHNNGQIYAYFSAIRNTMDRLTMMVMLSPHCRIAAARRAVDLKVAYRDKDCRLWNV
jgi:hypothetical protein